MAEKIAEMVTTGTCKLRDDYRHRIPADVAALTTLEGVGPKAVKVLWEKLGVRTLADLEAAARAGKVRDLPHFGERSEERILKALSVAQASGGRRLLAEVRPLVDDLVRAIRRLRGVSRVEVAGSVRRRRETVGDVDLLAIAREPADVVAAFIALPA